MPIELVHTSAPETHSIPEVRSEEGLRVFSNIYAAHPLLGDEKKKPWTVSLLTELHRANDSDLFRSDGKGWPLIEGKNFHQFIPHYEKTVFTVDPKGGLERTAKHREYRQINSAIHDTVRLGFRSVASSTNVRGVIACVLPPKSFSPHSVTLVLPSIGGVIECKSKDYSQLILYLVGIFNSFIFDYLIRTRVSMNLSFFYVYQTPVPSDYQNDIGVKIIRISGMLSSADHRFDELAKGAGIEVSRLEMRQRIELTAELNSLVAKQYGLTGKDLEIILNSFDGFKEDERILKMEGEIKWSDELIRKFNGEVRRRVLSYFDKL
jgi:hypothetical protein